MANLFSYNPFTGLSAGIPIVSDRIGREQKLLPSHVPCGSQYVQLDKNWEAPLEHGRLMNGRLNEINTASGARFYVIDKRRGDTTALLLLFQSRTKSRINAFARIEETNAKAVLYDRESETALIEFGPAGYVEIWTKDGNIHCLRREGDAIKTAPLTEVEAARYRVELMHQQVAVLDLGHDDDAIKRFHGILNGAYNLLRFAKQPESQTLLADFLGEQLGEHFPDTLRKKVRQELLSKRHPLAGHFADGEYGGNVVLLRPKPSAGRAKSDHRKRERAERDREIRASMRGPTGQRTSGKKGR